MGLSNYFISGLVALLIIGVTPISPFSRIIGMVIIPVISGY